MDGEFACDPPSKAPFAKDYAKCHTRSKGRRSHEEPRPEPSRQGASNQNQSRQPQGETMAVQSNVAECGRVDTSIASMSNTDIECRSQITVR